MHDDVDELTECLECGADISLGQDRRYILADGEVLCFVCAHRRGGMYDELADRWTVAPDLTGLTGASDPGS